MPAPTVRRAELADIDRIQELLFQVDRFHARLLPGVFRAGGKARSDDFLRTVIQAEESDFLLASLEARIVGALEIKETAPPDFPVFVRKRFALIENMVVEEGLRGGGIGTVLLEQALDWARGRGLASVQLTVWSENERALRFYQGQGFRTVVERMEIDL